MKKIISLLMVLCLMASLCSMSAFAEEEVPLPSAIRQVLASGGKTLTVPTISLSSPPGTATLSYALKYEADFKNPDFDKILAEYKDCPVDFRVMFSGIEDNMVTDPADPNYGTDKLVYGTDARLYGQYSSPLFSVGDNWVEFNELMKALGNDLEGVGFDSNVWHNMQLSGIVKYNDVTLMENGFSCGISYADGFLEANPNFRITLELIIYVNGEAKVVGEPVVVTPPPTPTPPPPPPVPMTADNSNMPLWGILFIGFAAVAVLTAKKKKA